MPTLEEQAILDQQNSLTPNDTPITPAPTNNELVTPPPAPALDPAVLNAYNGMLNDRARENAELKEKLRLFEEKQNTPAPQTDEEASADFFRNPKKFITEEINRAVAPINQDRAQFQRASDYARMKGEMVLDPRFVDLPLIEKEFDQLMSSQVLSYDSMIGAYFTTYGMVAASGKLESRRTPSNGNPPAPITPPAPIVTTPPHLRPTPPAAPNAPVVNNLRPLTENEETIRRANGLTVAEFLEGQSGGALVMKIKVS